MGTGYVGNPNYWEILNKGAGNALSPIGTSQIGIDTIFSIDGTSEMIQYSGTGLWELANIDDINGLKSITNAGNTIIVDSPFKTIGYISETTLGNFYVSQDSFGLGAMLEVDGGVVIDSTNSIPIYIGTNTDNGDGSLLQIGISPELRSGNTYNLETIGYGPADVGWVPTYDVGSQALTYTKHADDTGTGGATGGSINLEAGNGNGGGGIGGSIRLKIGAGNTNGNLYINTTPTYTGDLNDSTSTKIADVICGLITAVYY